MCAVGNKLTALISASFPVFVLLSSNLENTSANSFRRNVRVSCSATAHSKRACNLITNDQSSSCLSFKQKPPGIPRSRSKFTSDSSISSRLGILWQFMHLARSNASADEARVIIWRQDNSERCLNSLGMTLEEQNILCRSRFP